MVITVSEEQRQQTPHMDVECLAKFLFCALKERISSDSKPPDSFSLVELRKDLFPGVELGKNLSPGEKTKQERDANQQSYDNHSKLLEAVVLLERRGLVMRDSSYLTSSFGNFDHPPAAVDRSIVFVYLTSIGMNSDFDDGILLLVDKPQETVGRLEQEIGALDDVVRQYYLESIRAYQEGLYISSVICLGAASERAIHWLAESIESNWETHQKEIKRKKNENIYALTKYLSDTVIPAIFREDNKFRNELKNRLDGLGKVYRENRNDAGHPTRIVDQSWLREDQDRLLIDFRRYITTICKAIEKCRAS